MREEEKKRIQWMQRVLPMYFCTSPSCERERDFRCRECKRRLLEELYYERVEDVLFLVRPSCDGDFL